MDRIIDFVIYMSDSCVIHCKHRLIVSCVVCNNLYSSSVSSAKTVAGVINTAFKHLKTSFLLSLKRVAATDGRHFTCISRSFITS